MSTNKKRIELLDELRGFAILAMIVHHFFLDVGNVLDADWGYTVFDKLCILQPLFLAIFIIISGICSQLSHNTIKRGAVVLGAGLVITLVTAVIMPRFGFTNVEIYFGILSCLGCCMIITGAIQPLIDKTNTVVGMIISGGLYLFFYNINAGSLCFGLIDLPKVKTNWLMPLGLYNDSFHSADYFSLLPWIFMFLFGAFIGKYAKAGAFPQWSYRRHSKALAFIGRNSLWVYLAHQVVIYTILYIFLGLLKIYVKITM
ncbi:MAG: heparan-alpha-glucosaminide N-acetyltransferase [Eubacterium sp.]